MPRLDGIGNSVSETVVSVRGLIDAPCHGAGCAGAPAAPRLIPATRHTQGDMTSYRLGNATGRGLCCLPVQIAVLGALLFRLVMHVHGQAFPDMQELCSLKPRLYCRGGYLRPPDGDLVL